MADRLQHLHCSFCGKNGNEVLKLITGPQVQICDECVALCNEILAQDVSQQASTKKPRNELKPKEIYDYLGEHIIGQEVARKVVSVAVYNHYKRINASPDDEVQLSKGNILMVGPTGCGKTAIAAALAKLLDVPFVVADATCLTEAGYVGEDVESIIKSLWIAADRDVDRASRGIVVIDEIDKLAKRSTASSTRDVGGEGVQQALLKVIEGEKVAIYPDGSRTRPQKELIQVDTRNVLFILCGAFVGLEKVIQSRKAPSSIGFGTTQRSKNSLADYNELIVQVTAEDFIKFGLIPEFVGRLPVMVPFEQLSEDDMCEILWKPKNSLVAQYKRLFEMEGVNLEFTQDALRAIVREAIKRKSGARGLRAIMEETMLDLMYEIPDLEDARGVQITEGVILHTSAPEITYKHTGAVA